MAKIKIAGSAMVLESSEKLETLQKLAKFAPDALTLKDKDGNVTFAVGTVKGDGDINKYGVSFGSSQPNGYATVTKMIPSDVEDVKQYAADVYGAALLHLNDVEDQFQSALENVAKTDAKIKESIEAI